MREYLCYYELEVDDRTFYIHTTVRAKTLKEAQKIFAKNKDNFGKHHHLKLGGVIGTVKTSMSYLAENPSQPEYFDNAKYWAHKSKELWKTARAEGKKYLKMVKDGTLPQSIVESIPKRRLKKLLESE